MSIDYVALAAELTAGHPDTGPYNADDAIAASELNEPNRPDTVSIAEILKFLLMDNIYQTDGSDTQDRAIWTRLKDIDALAVTPDAAIANPWGSAAIGNVTEIRQIKATQLLNFFTLSAQGELPVNLQDTNFQSFVAGARQAGCLSTTQETALLALGDNLQSRAQEIELGRVKPGHVEQARAL